MSDRLAVGTLVTFKDKSIIGDNWLKITDVDIICRGTEAYHYRGELSDSKIGYYFDEDKIDIIFYTDPKRTTFQRGIIKQYIDKVLCLANTM